MAMYGEPHVAAECTCTAREFGRCARPTVRPGRTVHDDRDHGDGSDTRARGRRTSGSLTETRVRDWQDWPPGYRSLRVAQGVPFHVAKRSLFILPLPVFGEDPSGPLGRPPQAVDLSDGAGNGRHQRSTPHRSVSERSTRATVERQPAAERLVIGDVCGPTVRGSPRGVQGVVASPRSCGRALSRFVRGRVSPAAASRAAPRPPRVSQAPHASVSES